jgi:hypothetical protein
VTPLEWTSPHNGDEREIRVTAGQGCAWTAASQAPWLRVSRGSGTGAGTVIVKVEGNLLPVERTGRLLVAGRTIDVTQRGFLGNLQLSGALAGLTGTCPAVSFTIDGVRVRTDASTTFRTRCNRLRTGTRVTVRGRAGSDGVVLADRVERIGNNDDDDDNGDEGDDDAIGVGGVG